MITSAHASGSKFCGHEVMMPGHQAAWRISSSKWQVHGIPWRLLRVVGSAAWKLWTVQAGIQHLVRTMGWAPGQMRTSVVFFESNL